MSQRLVRQKQLFKVGLKNFESLTAVTLCKFKQRIYSSSALDLIFEATSTINHDKEKKAN